MMGGVNFKGALTKVNEYKTKKLRLLKPD